MLKAEEPRVGKAISMLDIEPKDVRMKLLSNNDKVSHKCGSHHGGIERGVDPRFLIDSEM
jgi:hypothetical protein